MDLSRAPVSTEGMLPSPTVVSRSESHLGGFVVVQRDWNGWRTATVGAGALEDIHWRQPHGAPRPLIHAYLSCSTVRPGDLDHQCDRTSAPHRILVCVLKCHTPAKVFAELGDRASAAGATR